MKLIKIFESQRYILLGIDIEWRRLVWNVGWRLWVRGKGRDKGWGIMMRKWQRFVGKTLGVVTGMG